MDQQPPPMGISEADWEATPASVKELVNALLPLLPLVEEVKQLRAEVAWLKEKLQQNSTNSSKPPSSDPPQVAKQKKVATGRRRGGQKGHRGHHRSLKPIAEVDEIIDLRPVSCANCDAPLLGTDPAPMRHQVTELPELKATTIEYRCHKLSCLACGEQTQAEWPAEMPRSAFGPRLQAATGYLRGRINASQRDIIEIMDVFFQVEMALGSVPRVCQAVSEALAKPADEALDYIREQSLNNIDETGWKQANVRHWLWVSVTTLMTVFVISARRATEVWQQILGNNYGGIVGSDRYSAYNALDPEKRQLCWAHLKRDFQAFVDRGGESARIGQALLDTTTKIFALWHQVKEGTLSRADFPQQIEPLVMAVIDLLEEGSNIDHKKTANTCTNILKVGDALWTFVWHEGVEPTNNAAEQALRRGVLWRKSSYGTQSEQGSRFVERILTVIASLKQQGREILAFLTPACQAAISGLSPPSLLPNTPPLS